MTVNSKLFGAASIFALSLAFSVLTVASAALFSVSSAEAAAIGSIDVRGNKRVEAKTIRNGLGISRGEDVNSYDIDMAVKRLFALGLFSDVRINQSGATLVVQVKEYDVVNQVLFQGNKALKNPDLASVVTLKPREPFDSSKLKADEQAISEAYKYVGRSDVSVTANVVNLGQGRVNVVFRINEGEKTKVAHIEFVGNNSFSGTRLRDVISTKKTSILSWLTRDDVYSSDRLAADKQALRRFYNNRGYADFYIASAKAFLNGTTNEYTIRFVVSEGAKYNFGSIGIESSIPGINTQSIARFLKSKQGDVYSINKVEDSVVAINDRVADVGYAFANVKPFVNRNFHNHTISLNYNIDKGTRAYVQRIDVRGNDKTREHVIRREFDLSEGDAFNQTLIQRAKRRLDGLGLFQSVNISTIAGSEADKIILVVDVVEGSTGDFSVGGGYTTGGETPGASVEASIAERNFLGQGQSVSISFGAGQKSSRNYNFSFTEPYFLGYRLAAGFDVFRNTYSVNNDYGVKQMGSGLRFGIPVTENLTGNISYNYVREEYTLSKSSKDDTDLRNRYGDAFVDASHRPRTRSSISYGLTYNSIDNMLNPHDGLFVRAKQEYAGLGGDAKYLKTSGKAMLYKTLSEKYDLVGLLSAGGGYVHKMGDNGIRFFDMFKSNEDMLRGFKYNGIGPSQFSKNGDRHFLGGTTYLNATAELQFPIPFVPESVAMRGAFFADAATIYGDPYKEEASKKGIMGDNADWRASVGASLMWSSPFGPLRFDYAWPVSEKEGDLKQRFHFGVSSKF